MKRQIVGSAGWNKKEEVVDRQDLTNRNIGCIMFSKH
jgi:hypothetical protein